MPKFLTRSEAATKKSQAVALMRRTGQDDKADEYESMSIEDYAAGKGAELLENPQRRNRKMARKTAAQLQDELDDAMDTIEELESRLDSIAGIASDDDDDSNGDDDSDNGDDDFED